MIAVASTSLSANTEARGVNDLGCSRVTVLFSEDKNLNGNVEEPCQSTLESRP
jgi:hypothetical protein